MTLVQSQKSIEHLLSTEDTAVNKALPLPLIGNELSIVLKTL